MPKEYRYVRASRHAKARSRPVSATLLPGYCFAAVDHDRAWSAIYDLHGTDGERLVWSALAVDGRPAQVPPEDMARLVVAANSFVPYTTASEARRKLTVGATEVIREGPYAGRPGEIADVRGERVRVWLPIFGSLRLLELPIAAFVGGEDDGVGK